MLKTHKLSIMATLLESVSVAVEASLFGIEAGKDDDSIIITHKKNFINILKLSDQKLTSSVPVKHGPKICSAAVWNSEKEQYLLVQNRKDVLSWTEESSNLDRAKKRHVPADIHKLFSLPSYEPVVLCKNGNAGFLSASKELHENPVLKDHETIVWCSAHALPTGVYVIYTTTQSDSKNGSLDLHTCWYDSQSDIWHQHSSSVTMHGALAACACALNSQNQVRFLTLWEHGELHETVVGETSCHERGQLLKIPGLSSQCCLFCLSENHIAVVGLQKDNNDGIGILDIKFGTVQAWQPFPEDLAEDRQAFCQQEHLFVHCGKTLYLYRYECHLSTLASILGQQQAALTDKDCGPVHIDIELWTAADTVTTTDGEAESKAVLTVFNNLVDPVKTSSYTAFKREFGVLKNKLSKTGLETWACTNAMSLLIQRCCSETKFWPKAELEFLIEQHCVSSSNTLSVFEALMQKEELDMLHTALKSFGEVPEACLVMALKCFLAAGEEKLRVAYEHCLPDSSMEMNGTDPSPDSAQCPFSNSKMFFVNYVLCFPFTDAYLLESMRKLPFSLVLDLLHFILYSLQQAVQIHRDGHTPSSDQVYDWLAITVDAHNTHLILAKDAHELLVKVREEVEHHANFCAELGKLEPILNRLKTLKHKSTHTRSKAVGQYCIEVLHLY